MSSEVFISFASKDARVAMTLCSALESRGFPCWIAARDIQPGENFQVAIVRALRRARVMLLVFTANSNTSEEMTKELALASQQKIMVIPCRVEDVTPNDAFAYEFATRQWIDVFSDWELAIEQLSRRVAHALGADAAAPPPALPADEPAVTAELAPDLRPVEPAPPEPEPVKAEVAEAAPRPRTPAPDPVSSRPAPTRDGRRLAMALAAAAFIGVAVAVAVSAVFLNGPKDKAAPALASAPAPRIAAAVASAPAQAASAPERPPPAAAPSEVEPEPELTRTSAKPRRKAAEAQPAVDIPF